MKSNLSFIYPIVNINDDIKNALTKAFQALKDVKPVKQHKILFVGDESNLKIVEDIYNNSKCKIASSLIISDSDNFFELINKGASACVTKYFTILEPNDCVMEYWTDIATERGENSENISILLPLAEAYDKNGTFIGFKNEMSWSSSFVKDELGYITKDELEAYMDFKVNGALIKTEDFISYGGVKPSLKVASWYEFLLRFAYNSLKIYTMPKVGIMELNGNKDSYFANMFKSVSSDEGEWLIDTAKQEYFFKQDRKKVYNKEEKEEKMGD